MLIESGDRVNKERAEDARGLLAPHRPGRAAPGLTPRGALEKLAAVQMLDVRFPTTDGRVLKESGVARDTACRAHSARRSHARRPQDMTGFLKLASPRPLSEYDFGISAKRI